MSQLFTLRQSVYCPASQELVERKSRFIAQACHIDSPDEALAFIAVVRKEHPKARHVAYAAICGADSASLVERMSDDGEPSGTAGKPIFDVLRAQMLTNTVVSVTRYFGGILLGAGGLVRAYASSAALVVEQAHKVAIIEWKCYRITTSYAQLSSLQHVVSSLGGCVCNEQYADDAVIEVQIPADCDSRFHQLIQQRFGVSIAIAALSSVYQPQL